jgi:hypothetical protein
MIHGTRENYRHGTGRIGCSLIAKEEEGPSKDIIRG